jgi:hypothetical protein
MSTKLYSGYKLPQMSLGELQDFSMKFRKKIRKKFNLLHNSLLASISVDIVDAHALGQPCHYIREHELEKDELKIRPASQVCFYIMDRHSRIERTQERDPDFDFNCSVVFFPLQDCILALLFAEKKEYASIWEKMPGVEFYGYWDNTDRDESVTAKEWNQRRVRWGKALLHRGGMMAIPSLHGFSIDCLGKYEVGYRGVEDYLHLIPTFENRVSAWAKTILRNVFYKEKDKEKKLNDDFIESMFSHLKSLSEYEKTEEFKQKFEIERERISRILKKEILKEDLLRELIFNREKKDDSGGIKND